MKSPYFLGAWCAEWAARFDRPAWDLNFACPKGVSVLFATLFAVSTGHAQRSTAEPSLTKANSSHFELIVHRNSDTLDCPDARLLHQAFSTHSHGEPEVNLDVTIRFARQFDEIVAKIEAAGYRTGKRELRLSEQNCGAFSEPLAVYLALLIDPNSVPKPLDSTKISEFSRHNSHEEGTDGSKPPEESAPPSRTFVLAQASTEGRDDAAIIPSKREVTVPAPRPTPSLVRSPNDLKLRLSAGPISVLGLVPHSAFGVDGEIDIGWRQVSLHLQGSQFVKTSESFGDGTLHGQTRMLRLGVCGERALGRHAQLSLCAATWVSKISVRTEDFATNGSSAPLLWAFGSTGQLRIFESSWWGGQIEMGWMIPTERHVFTIEGVRGEAFRTNPAAFTLGFAGWVEVW